MSVFLDDAHSILRQPALICANGIGIPAFLNSEHSMVLYLRLYLAFRFFPIAGTAGAIPWPTERSIEVLKDRSRRHSVQPLQQDARLPCPSRRRAAAGPHDDRIPPFVQLPDPLCDRLAHIASLIEAFASPIQTQEIASWRLLLLVVEIAVRCC